MEDEEEESRGDVAMDEVFIPPLLPLSSFFPFIFFFFFSFPFLTLIFFFLF